MIKVRYGNQEAKNKLLEKFKIMSPMNEFVWFEKQLEQ
jgi:hypothetical protein